MYRRRDDDGRVDHLVKQTLFSAARSCLAFLFCVSDHTTRMPRVVKHIWIGGLLCFLSLLASTSLFGLPNDRSMSQFLHTAWTAKDGAPSSVQALAQTTDGFLWLGAADGLYRFDGVTFERYHPSSWAAFPSPHVQSLMALPNGDLTIRPVNFDSKGLGQSRNSRLRCACRGSISRSKRIRSKSPVLISRLWEQKSTASITQVKGGRHGTRLSRTKQPPMD